MESDVPKIQIRRSYVMQDVTLFKKHVIDNHKDKFEVWPFAFGDEFLGVSSVASSAYTMFFFRRKLRLLYQGRVTCYLPVIGLSAIFSGVFHDSYTNYKIMNNRCSICTEVTASIGQAVIASVYPLMLSPVISFFLADRLFTYPVPPVTAPKELFQLWQMTVRANARTFMTLCGIQMILAMYVTREKFGVLRKLSIREKNVG